MPWCPRCDETFPEGPACPRCGVRLIAREGESPEDTLHAVPGLRSIKVSRRYLKALERLNAPPRQSSARPLALALVLLVFASGFLLGRVGDVGIPTPTVQSLPSSDELVFEDIKGSVSYLISSRDRVSTIALHDLFSGTVTPRARFSPPFQPGDHVATRMVTFGRSVAVVVTANGRGWVAFAPYSRDGRRPSHGWIPGTHAAWLSETELVIRRAGGEVTRWTVGVDSVSAKVAGDAEEIIQTQAGAILRTGQTVRTVGGPRRTLRLGSAKEVLAVSPDTTRAVVDASRPALWNGEERTPLRTSGRAIGASFDPSGERAAVLLADDGELTLAVVDAAGGAALKPLGAGKACGTSPAWDASGRWIYVATDDGVLHAISAGGGMIESIKTNGVGCGVAWVDIA